MNNHNNDDFHVISVLKTAKVPTLNSPTLFVFRVYLEGHLAPDSQKI